MLQIGICTLFVFLSLLVKCLLLRRIVNDVVFCCVEISTISSINRLIFFSTLPRWSSVVNIFAYYLPLLLRINHLAFFLERLFVFFGGCGSGSHCPCPRYHCVLKCLQSVGRVEHGFGIGCACDFQPKRAESIFVVDNEFSFSRHIIAERIIHRAQSLERIITIRCAVDECTSVSLLHFLATFDFFVQFLLLLLRIIASLGEKEQCANHCNNRSRQQYVRVSLCNQVERTLCHRSLDCGDGSSVFRYIGSSLGFHLRPPLNVANLNHQIAFLLQHVLRLHQSVADCETCLNLRLNLFRILLANAKQLHCASQCRCARHSQVDTLGQCREFTCIVRLGLNGTLHIAHNVGKVATLFLGTFQLLS